MIWTLIPHFHYEGGYCFSSSLFLTQREEAHSLSLYTTTMYFAMMRYNIPAFIYFCHAMMIIFLSSISALPAFAAISRGRRARCHADFHALTRHTHNVRHNNSRSRRFLHAFLQYFFFFHFFSSGFIFPMPPEAIMLYRGCRLQSQASPSTSQ